MPRGPGVHQGVCGQACECVEGRENEACLEGVENPHHPEEAENLQISRLARAAQHPSSTILERGRGAEGVVPCPRGLAGTQSQSLGQFYPGQSWGRVAGQEGRGRRVLASWVSAPRSSRECHPPLSLCEQLCWSHGLVRGKSQWVVGSES